MTAIRRAWPLLAACWGGAAAVHVAFIAPPASHYVAMLPIAHGLLDAGHNVTFLGIEETLKKIGKLVPQARMERLEASMPAEENKKKAIRFAQSIPYEAGAFFTNLVIPMMGNSMVGVLAFPAKPVLQKLKPDVLCVSLAYPILYALGEALNIPVVGISWGTPAFLTTQLDQPWNLEPNVGSIHSRREITENPAVLLLNLVVRAFGTFVVHVASLLNSFFRFKLGHPQPLELWEFDTVLQHPSIIPTLPEFTGGFPHLMSPYSFMVGILDHPAMQGQSIAKSDDAPRIMAWLDEQHAAQRHVYYVAFGSEVLLSDEMIQLMAATFAQGSFNVLWSTKVTPTIELPPTVLVTKFAPQRAVLQHPAVVGFLSHGGANSVNDALMLGTPLVIMPFLGDQMQNAVIQRELGVALTVRKDATTGEFVAALKEIATEPFQRRAREVRELNEKRQDMSRAVEVIVNQATGKFHMRIPAAPNVWVQLAPLILTALLSCWCCSCCCCCSVRPQLPCACCCRGGRRSARNGKAKKE